MHKANSMTLIALMTAIICIISPIAFVIQVSPVPITLGLFSLHLTVYLLGMKKGTLSCLIYIAIGLVGLPVFSGFVGGAGQLFGPTGGYIIGYIFCCLLGGFFVDLGHGKWHLSLIGMVLGTAACYIFGTCWLSLQLHVSFVEGLAMAVLPYIPADCIKIAMALLVGIPVRRALLKADLLH